MSDNPSAFPNTDNSTWGLRHAPGMTLRDWFAGQVLASAAALPLGDGDYAYRAKIAYEQADAMLAARATGSPQ